MGQAASSQGATNCALGRKISQNDDMHRSSTNPRMISLDADAGLLDSARALQHTQYITARALIDLGTNDGDRAYFCPFCDRSFSSNDCLEQHLIIHDPLYQPRTPRNNVRRPVTPSSSCCWICDKSIPTKRLANHHALAEKHRNVEDRRELRTTTDRPELWCALCETRFTHRDRKRKHMEEMILHNTRFRELRAQALRDPEFDHSIFERPVPQAQAQAQAHDPRTQSTQSETSMLRRCYCRVCAKAMPSNRVVDHHLLAERHRNVRTRNDLRPTNDRPDLWCAFCETRFTHTDRKRKHMEEMNTHNTQYSDLQSQALREPTFDRSILELPSPPSFPQDEDENRDATEEDEGAIHYCSPCNRYCSSGDELTQHQTQNECIDTGSNQTEQPPVSELATRPLATQSETDLPSALPPPYTLTPDQQGPPPPGWSLRAPHSIANIQPSSSAAFVPSPPAPTLPAPATHAPQLTQGASLTTSPRTLECALCLEHEDNLSSLACGHIFGTQCIIDALQDTQHCPLCREPAETQDLRRVFLS